MSAETQTVSTTPTPDLEGPAPAAPVTTKKVPVLRVSPLAVAEIRKLGAKRETEGKAPAFGLRVGIRGGGCTGFGYLFECATVSRARRTRCTSSRVAR